MVGPFGFRAFVDSAPVLEKAAGQQAGLAGGASGQEALKAAFLGGLDVRGFALKEPTLHDAFIGLTGDHPDQPQTSSHTAEAAR